MKKAKYPCLNPVQCWEIGTVVAKDGVVSDRLCFSYSDALRYYESMFGSSGSFHLSRHERAVDCGKCVNCLARKRRDMATRLRHEQSVHEKCCFLTLTYNDDSLPMTDDKSWREGHRVILDRGDSTGVPTLLPRDVQLFIKRLRRHLEYRPVCNFRFKRDHVDTPIRYFAVGEYGTKTSRPHYHIIIFGWEPSDLVVYQRRSGYCVYRSAQIEKLWTHGFSTVGQVNAGVVSYCARYVTKKFRNLAEEGCDSRCPEFVLQSVKNGGMGSGWLHKYRENVRSGYVTCRSKDGSVIRLAVPRYYYSRLRKIDLPLWLELRDQRISFVKSGFDGDFADYYDEVKGRVCKTLYEYQREDERSIF